MFSFFLLIFLSNNAASEDLPVLELTQGKIQGSIRLNLFGEKFYAFQGIPYAQPPIGALRFKNPEPASPWDGVWDGTKEGPKCTQINKATGTVIGQEDCLYLNVYIPTLPTSDVDPKPVMVLLHGGSYAIGHGGEEFYGPDYLLTEDIIYVAMNFRLNIFGFLSFEDPSVEVFGNMGLKDQVMALRWIQENIANFGGDPNKVTIFGKRVGGASVSLMLLSPLANGLFHRAISQSGASTSPWTFSERRYKNFASYLNYPGGMEDDQKEIFDFLNAQSSETLMLAQHGILTKDDLFIGDLTEICVVIENPNANPGAFITKHPVELFKNGEFTQVPTIIGFTNNEGSIFASGKTFMKPDFNDNELLVPRYFNLNRGSSENKDVGNKIKAFYYGDKTPNNSTLAEFTDLMTDIVFSHGNLKVARLMMEKSSAPIYFYLFQYKSALSLASHIDDNRYLFPVKIHVEPDSPEMRGIHRNVRLWTTFARMGDPNQHEPDELLIEWPKATLDNFQYLIIQDGMELGTELYAERDQFWTDLENNLGIQ